MFAANIFGWFKSFFVTVKPVASPVIVAKRAELLAEEATTHPRSIINSFNREMLYSIDANEFLKLMEIYSGVTTVKKQHESFFDKESQFRSELRKLCTKRDLQSDELPYGLKEREKKALSAIAQQLNEDDKAKNFHDGKLLEICLAEKAKVKSLKKEKSTILLCIPTQQTVLNPLKEALDACLAHPKNLELSKSERTQIKQVKEITRLKIENEEQKNEIEQLKSNNAVLAQEIKVKDKKIENLEEKIKEQDERIKEQDKRIKEQDKRIKEQDERLKKQEQGIKELKEELASIKSKLLFCEEEMTPLQKRRVNRKMTAKLNDKKPLGVKPAAVISPTINTSSNTPVGTNRSIIYNTRQEHMGTLRADTHYASDKNSVQSSQFN